MATQTTHYNLSKPGVNDPTDQDLWGNELNANMDIIDATMFSNSQSSLPIGVGFDYWGSAAPAKCIFPYGQAISRTTYALLFAVLGVTYGVGDGSTTFNLPDKSGRVSFAADNLSGTPAGRLTKATTDGIDGTAIGNTGGVQDAVLIAGQIPAITGTVPARTGVGPTAGGGGPVAVGASDNTTLPVTINGTGGGTPVNTLPPGIVCNYVIYAGA